MSPWCEARSKVALLLKNYRDVGNPKALDRQRMVSFYFRWFGNLVWINIYVLFVVNFSRIDFFLSFFIFIIVKSFLARESIIGCCSFKQSTYNEPHGSNMYVWNHVVV